MNKTSKYMILALLSGATFAACSDTDNVIDDINNSSAAAQPMTFTAAQESNGTRATVNGNKIEWQSTDHLSVFDGTSNCDFSIDAIDADNATSATFTGEAAAATTYTALYPYQSTAALSSTGVITGVTLPANQTATAGSFDPAAALMMAVTADSEKDFAFKNAVAYLKVTTAEPAQSISFTSLGDENLAGTVILSYNAGAPTANVTANGSSTVTLAPTSGTFAAGTYYLAVLPQTLTAGFKLSYTDASGDAHIRKYATSYTIARNQVIDMGEINSMNAPAAVASLAWTGSSNAWLPSGKTKTSIKGVVIETNQSSKPSDAKDVTATGSVWTYVDDSSILHIQTSSEKIKPTTAKKFFEDYSASATITGLDKLDLSNVTSTEGMFSGCLGLTSLDVSDLNTENVTNMSGMFKVLSSLGNDKFTTIIGLDNLNTSKVTNMDEMFANRTKLQTLDLSMFDTKNVTTMVGMFGNCKALCTITLSENFQTGNVENMNHMFYECQALQSLDLSHFDTQKVTDMCCMFYDCKALSRITLSENFQTGNVENMKSMFYGCRVLQSLDLSHFDTQKVTDMSSMFKYCEKLTTIDVSKFNTGNVTDMSGMFMNCSVVTTLDVSSFNTEKVTDMSYMFNKCKALTSLNLSNFNTTLVTSMQYMFNYCNKLTTLSFPETFNTEKVTNMSGMFSSLSLTSLDVSRLNTKNVTTMYEMFSGCFYLTSISGLDKFNTSSVTDMREMFLSCSKLSTLDLSSFNTAKVTVMTKMFYSCKSLSSLELSSNFVLPSSSSDYQYIFSDAAKSVSSLNVYNAPTSMQSTITSNASSAGWNSSKMSFTTR